MASDPVAVHQGVLSRREKKEDENVWLQYRATLYDDGRLVLEADGLEGVVELTTDDVISESRVKNSAFQIANAKRTVIFAVDTFKLKTAWLGPLSAVINDLGKPRRARTAASQFKSESAESKAEPTIAAAPAPAPIGRTTSNQQLNGSRPRRADFAHPDAPAPTAEPSNNPFDLKKVSARSRDSVRHRRTASVESDSAASVAQTDNSQEMDVKSVHSDNMSVLGVSSTQSGSSRHPRQDSDTVFLSGVAATEATSSGTQSDNPLRARMARRTPSNRELQIAPESGDNPFDLKAVSRPPTAGRSRRGEESMQKSQGAALGGAQTLSRGTRTIMDTALPSMGAYGSPPLRRAHSFQPDRSPPLFEPSSPLVQPPSPTRSDLAARAQQQEPTSPGSSGPSLESAEISAGMRTSGLLSSSNAANPAHGRAAASPLRRAQSVRLRPTSFADRMQTAMAGAPVAGGSNPATSLRQEVLAGTSVTSTPPVRRTFSTGHTLGNDNESTPIIRPLPTGAAPVSDATDDSPVRPTSLSMGKRATSLRYGRNDLANAFSAELGSITEEASELDKSSTRRKPRVWSSLATALGRGGN